MTEDWEGGTLEESGKLEDPRYRCKHGTFIGDPYGPDYMCPLCELGIDDEAEELATTWHISAIFAGRNAPDTLVVKAAGIQEAYNVALNIWDTHESRNDERKQNNRAVSQVCSEPRRWSRHARRR